MPITNAQLAQQILDMVDARIQFDLEHHEWLTGVVGGGDFADGKYLLTNPITQVSRYTTCPAQLEDDVNGLVSSASTFSTDAQNAATAAGISETNAAASAASALSEKNLAVAEKVSAQNAQSAAENAAVTATAQAAAALTSANNAATSASNAATSETNAATSETNALASELKAQDWAEQPEDVPVEIGQYSALHWAAKAAASAATFTEVNDLTAAVVWANVPNANITQGAVTQHQAALSITESQISDLGSYLPLGGGTVTGRLVAGFVEDVSLAGVSGSLIIGGDGTGLHIAIDNNEIMAKASATTTSALNLQVNGGTVACGGPLTVTGAITEGGTSLASKYLGISAQAADSALLDGSAKAMTATASTIVQRTAAGYINAVYFNSSQGAETSTASHYIYQAGSDGYYRKKTLANARTEIVTAAAVNAVATEASTVSTAVKRNASGDINARLFRSEYDSTNATINYIMTQIDTATNNYIRPSTPAQFRSSVNAGYLGAEPYTVSTSAPSGGGDGDFWFQREV